MACPFFFPVDRLDDSRFTVPPRLPLGYAYSGECHARKPVAAAVGPTLHRACNTGYARAVCEFFPLESAVDAVRFHVTSVEPASIRLRCIVERDCWPAGSHDFEFARPGFDCLAQHSDAVMRRQARVFAESYVSLGL